MDHMSGTLTYVCPVTFSLYWYTVYMKYVMSFMSYQRWVGVYNAWRRVFEAWINVKQFWRRVNVFHLQSVPTVLQYLETFLWFSNFVRTFVCDHRWDWAKDGFDRRLQLLGDFLSPPLSTTHPLVKLNSCEMCVKFGFRKNWISWLEMEGLKGF